MRQDEPGLSAPLSPHELIKRLPEEAFAASDRRQWVGLEAVRYRDQPPNENLVPPLTHNMLLLFLSTPKEFEVCAEGICRVVPPPAGSILMVPAGQPARYRWSGHSDSLHVFLDQAVVARVAAEVFELDAARASILPLDGLDLPPLRSAMLSVNDELVDGGAGGGLATESLANLIAVHLLRNTSASQRTARRTDGALSRSRLRAVIEYIEGHVDTALTLEQMAAIAHLSAYHFARQFKASTGLSPHQYVIARRVERAQQLLREGDDLALAAVAAGAGFSDQSQFSHHFKRRLGMTPGQFRRSARNA